MQQREVEIVNTRGLNARASRKLAQLAVKYRCVVSLTRNGRKVNAKSLMGLIVLAAGKGSHLVLETHGSDETEALDAIVALIAGGFGASQMRRGEARIVAAAPARNANDTTASASMPEAPGRAANERSR